jgi:ribosomal protein S18 acetylase RimI-like enzyme
VRRALPSDLEYLPDVDRRAESLFRVAGMNLPDIPFPLDELHDSRAVFVAGRPPVAFVQIDEVDGIAHVQELAVLPSHMRQGLGSALLDAACEWARAAGYPAITLTTYADVPWNAPYYQARGFTELSELTPELVELRDWERDVGLDAIGRRIAMRRELIDPPAD